MDSTLVISSPLEGDREDHKDNGDAFSHVPFLKKKETSRLTNFIWPKEALVKAHEELREPLVDLDGFLGGDVVATQQAATDIREACLNHGFFQVRGHGVDLRLSQSAYDHIDSFFKLPASTKLRAKIRPPENMWGYSGAHANRFSSKLPWKETLTFGFHESSSGPVVADFFKSSLGMDFEQAGAVYQKYCEAMKEVALAIMELLAISLGVDRVYYRRFFQDGYAIMRCNYYPPCEEPGLVFGTGPHFDPTSITILHQDHVGGLNVFSGNKWKTVPPRHDALVINLGDTFKVLSNGTYKSCLHRAMVNKETGRKTMTFFFNPREDKVLTPPEDLVRRDGTRTYPDFTWSDFRGFTQTHQRADSDTLPNFVKWFHDPSRPPADLYD